MANAIPARNLPVLNFDYHLPDLLTYRFVHVNGKTNHEEETPLHFLFPSPTRLVLLLCHGSVTKRNHVT